MALKEQADGLKSKPNGYLVNSDLASDMSTPAYKSLAEISRRTFQYAEFSTEEIGKVLGTYGQTVVILPPQEVESIIASSGFDLPVLFFQTALVRAWYAKRSQ